MSLARIELLWLVVLGPLAALSGLWLWRRVLGSYGRWAARQLWPRLGLTPDRSAMRWTAVLTGLAVGATALSLAQPRWGAGAETVERRAVDLVFVLDSSLSMAARDLAPTRLATAKEAIRRVARALPGNRVALVQAEGSGVVLTPLTLDTPMLDLLLDGVEAGSLPVPGTRLAIALEAAYALFADEVGDHRVLVLISDGEDHGERSLRTARDARRRGVVTHCLGVGSLDGAPIPLSLDRRPEYKLDAAGQIVVSRLDERHLERIARAGGGLYRRLDGTTRSLPDLVAAIDGMSGRPLEEEVVATERERFQWLLALAALAIVGHLRLRPLDPPRSETDREGERR